MTTCTRRMNVRTQTVVRVLLLGLCAMPFTGAMAEDGERRERDLPREQHEGEEAGRMNERVRRATVELEQHRRNLDALAEELEREMQNLRDRDGPEAKAHRERLEGAMREVRAERQKLEERHRHLRKEVQMHALEQRMEELIHAREELEGADGPEAGVRRARIENALNDTRHRMETLRAGDEREPVENQAPDRRARHLRVAAENLMAAGMEDEGRRILEHAEELEMRRRGREIENREREARARRDPDRDLRVQVDALTDVVHDLREAMHDLREDFEELREELEEEGVDD